MKKLEEKYAELSNKIYDICTRKEMIRRKCMGLGSMECKMLNYLYRMQEPICMNDLSTEMEVSHSRITRIIDALVSKGLVDRFPSKKDRRSWLAEINQKGIETNDNSLKDFLELQNALIKKLPKSKIEPILKNLEIFVIAYQETLTEKENSNK